MACECVIVKGTCNLTTLSAFKPRTVDITIAPAAARVFKIESAYLSVAATSRPPRAPKKETLKVNIDQLPPRDRPVVYNWLKYIDILNSGGFDRMLT